MQKRAIYAIGRRKSPSRVSSCAGMGPMLLDTQYRMHPLIAEYPSARFYNGLLRSGISAEDRPLAKGQSPQTLTP